MGKFWRDGWGMGFAMLLSMGCGASQTGATNGGGATAASEGGTLVGKEGPAFVLPSANQKPPLDLKKYRGKVVIVDFWATWCEPCKKSFPKLQILNAKYRGAVVILGISQDEESSGLAAFAKSYGAEFAVGWDSDKSIARKWNPPTMPTSFIVDKGGIVRYIHQGYRDGDEAELDKLIKSLL